MDKKYVVYQHVTPDGMYYFGQTQNVEKRWEGNGIHYKRTSLQPYIEKYGWENIKHIVLFRDQMKEDALWIENFLIETAREDGVCINQRRSGLISKEEGYNQQKSKHYYEKNKDKINERHKQYQEQNRDRIKEYQREHYEQNKDKIKQYREQNRDKIKERDKQYYEQNKDKIKEQQKQYRKQNKDKIQEQNKHYYEENKDKIREQRRQRYQKKKEEKHFKEFGSLPLW